MGQIYCVSLEYECEILWSLIFELWSFKSVHLPAPILLINKDKLTNRRANDSCLLAISVCWFFACPLIWLPGGLTPCCPLNILALSRCVGFISSYSPPLKLSECVSGSMQEAGRSFELHCVITARTILMTVYPHGCSYCREIGVNYMILQICEHFHSQRSSQLQDPFNSLRLK